MKRLTLLLTVLMSSQVLSGCKEQPQLQCPKPNLPLIVPIDKIHKQALAFEPDGSMKTDSAQTAYRQLRAYSISEHYYFTTLTDYIALRDNVMKDN